MVNSPSRSLFNPNLEALRGVAAMLVVWHHVIYHQHQLDPGYVPTRIAAFNPPGHEAVIIFFVLSGYVIGLSHPAPLGAGRIGPYLYKRFVRLYPMYALAVLAGAVVSGFSLPLRTVVQHLCFWQSWGDPVMFENNPLWSLQYEVLYYLAFIPLSALRVPPWRVAAGAALLGTGVLFLKSDSFNGPFAQYLIGFSFWATGWALAARPPAGLPAAPNWPRILGALLLLLGLEHLNPLALLAHQLTDWLAAHQWPLNSSWCWDFAFLPFAASIVLRVAGGEGRWARGLGGVLQLLPLLMVAAVYGWLPLDRGGAAPGRIELAIPLAAYGLSLLLYLVPLPALRTASRWVVQRLVPLGAISYGIYVIHFPLVFLFGKVLAFSGTALTFAVRAAVYLPLLWLAATWLDKVYQPWIKKRLHQRLAAAPPA